jgi:hypothetical protein
MFVDIQEDSVIKRLFTLAISSNFKKVANYFSIRCYVHSLMSFSVNAIGSCVCEADLGGADCSVNMTVTPAVWFLENNGLCDLQQRRCLEVAVFGGMFVMSGSLTCRLTPVKVMTNFILVVVCQTNYKSASNVLI